MSWEQLRGIRTEARRDAQLEAARPPVACPVDGTVLDSLRGVLHCPWCGWTSG